MAYREWQRRAVPVEVVEDGEILSIPRVLAICAHCASWAPNKERGYRGWCSLLNRGTGRGFSCEAIQMTDAVAMAILDDMARSGDFPDLVYDEYVTCQHCHGHGKILREK